MPSTLQQPATATVDGDVDQLILAIAVRAALEAGEFLLNNLGGSQRVNAKYSHTIKLQADRDTEEIIIGVIRESFPEHSIFSEETGAHTVPGARFKWILDPLDGTSNYYRDTPHFCTSIACWNTDNQPVCGVIFDPCRNELFSIRRGDELMLNGKPRFTSDTDDAGNAIVAMGYCKREPFFDEASATYNQLIRQFGKVRHSGSTALDLAWTAAGRYDVCLENGIYLWDIAAAAPMILAAGGDWYAAPLHDEQPLQVHFAATNGHLHLHNVLELDRFDRDLNGLFCQITD